MLRPLLHDFLPFSLPRQLISGRKLVAGVTAFAFALLLCAAFNHYHETALETQACLVCAVVAHKVSFNNPAVKLQQFVTLFLYQAPSVGKTYAVVDTSACLLPPSCGPPTL